MNVSSDKRKRKLVVFLATGVLLAMVVLALVEAPQIVRAGESNLAAVASPTPQPHLLWQYDVVVAINPAQCAGQNGLFFYGNGDVLISGGGALSYAACQAKTCLMFLLSHPTKFATLAVSFPVELPGIHIPSMLET